MSDILTTNHETDVMLLKRHLPWLKFIEDEEAALALLGGCP